MRTLVLGLGNPIRADDGVGLHVARFLAPRLRRRGVTVAEAGNGGLALLDLLVGYDRAILVDAIRTSGGAPGRIYRLEPDALDTSRHASSLHDLNFATALALGRTLGLDLPRQIVIFAVEAEDVLSFAETCTGAVAGAIPLCANRVLRELGKEPNHDG